MELKAARVQLLNVSGAKPYTAAEMPPFSLIIRDFSGSMDSRSG